MSKLTDLSVRIASHRARIIKFDQSLADRDKLSTEEASETAPPTSTHASGSTNPTAGKASPKTASG